MKRQILVHNLILLIVGTLITGFTTSELSQKFYKSELKSKLENTAKLIDHQISIYKKNNLPIDYNQTAKQYTSILSDNENKTHQNDTRITFIDYSGKVIGESDANYLAMENHHNRKEIIEALDGKIGNDIRLSKTTDVELLYIAKSITSEKIIVRIAVPLYQMKSIDEIIIIYTCIGMFGGLIVTILLAIRFSSIITKPVNELIKVTRDISAGNYSRRSTLNLDGEIGILSSTFNEMAEKLETTLAEMSDKNLKIESILNSMINGVVAVDNHFKIILINKLACEMFDIDNGPGVIGLKMIELVRNSHINKMLKDTIKRNISQVSEITINSSEDKIYRVFTTPINSNNSNVLNSGGIVTIHDITNIKKLEQIRTEFVSNVTHELKTPLTSIRGFIETLKNGAIEDRNISLSFLDIIDIESERLTILINDILQLSEIENKLKDSDIAQNDVKSILKEIFDILQGTAQKKEVTLNFEVEEGLTVNANRNRIKQMLINLIDNGIKYNIEDGFVNVKAYKDHGKVTFIIKDSGIGISDEHIPRIFERFYRVDKGRSRNMGGTGLGLSIVKHIVNLYSGNIQINSKTGCGTEFIIQLPS